MSLTTRSVKGSPLTHDEMDANWSYVIDSANNTFAQSGTGASTRTVQAKLRDVVTPLDFGAAGDDSTDDTAAIQAAINTGKTIDLVGLKYRAHGLTQSTILQSIVSSQGVARITKNANGVLFTSTASNCRLQNISFWGDASSPTFTGDNVNASGDHFVMINCGSRWTSGRAVKATGHHTQIYGTCDIYQTTDATASGYDIEIGVSGTATIYHELHGIYSSQATGGILLTDVGSHTIVGGQFGKLKIAAGTLPAGVNAGKTIGARILGNVNVEISNATFTANQFGAVAITLGSGTTGHKIDASNTFENGYGMFDNSSDSSVVMDTFKGEFIKTWTPADGSGATLSLTIGDAIAYKIGQIAEVSFSIIYPVTASGASAQITGLPFQAFDSNNAIGGGGVSYTDAGISISMLVGANGTAVTFWKTDGTAVTNANLSGKQLRGTLVYRTST